MDTVIEQQAADLLRALAITSYAGTVLYDETRTPGVFKVYVFDEHVPLDATISQWEGHPVEIIRTKRPSPQGPSFRANRVR